MNLVRAAAVAIFAFVGIVWVAQVTGHTYLLPGGGGGVAGRFANGRGISLGPLSFSVFSIDVGSIAAIGMPAAVILALGARSRWARLFYVAMVLAFAAILAFTGARGAMIGAVSGTLLALLLSRRLTLRRIILGVLAAIMVLAVAGTRLVDLLPPAVVSAIGELRGGVGSVGDFRIRLGVWEVTLAAVSKN